MQQFRPPAPGSVPAPTPEREAHEERIVASYQQSTPTMSGLQDPLRAMRTAVGDTRYCADCDVRWQGSSECWSCGPITPEREGTMAPSPDDFAHPGGWRTVLPGEG